MKKLSRDEKIRQVEIQASKKAYEATLNQSIYIKIVSFFKGEYPVLCVV